MTRSITFASVAAAAFLALAAGAPISMSASAPPQAFEDAAVAAPVLEARITYLKRLKVELKAAAPVLEARVAHLQRLQAEAAQAE